MSVAAQLAILVIAFGGGCIVDINYGQGTYLCETEPKSCGPGMECREGRCVPEGQQGDAGTNPDAKAALALPDYMPPVMIAELSAMMAEDDDPSFTSDLLLVVFNSDRDGVGDLYTSTRNSIDEPWSTPTREAVLSSASAESQVALSGDGLTILFGSTRAGGQGARDVWMSTRPTRTAVWSPPVNVPSLSSPETDAPSWVSSDRRTVILNSRRDGVSHMFQSTFNDDTGEYDAPVQISELATDDGEFSGRLTADELLLTYHSNRSTGLGGGDIYFATRPDTGSPFGPPTLVTGVNGPFLDEDAWVSPDLCTILFASRGADDDAQLFQARCQ